MTISPLMIDAVILAVGGEFILLAVFLQRAGRSGWILPAFWFLASGALLMAALRLALSASAGALIALPLLASLVTHFLLIWAVWQRIKKARP